MADLKVSDLVDYPEKNFSQVKDCLVKLKELTEVYTTMDSLYDLEGLERLKRDMIAQLEFLAEQYSKVKKYKTGGDYLEETRKFLKSQAIVLLVNESDSKVSNNQAEKEIYAYPYYKDRVDLMQNIKSYFIKVELMFNIYKDVLDSVRQSISLCKKDVNYKPIEE